MNDVALNETFPLAPEQWAVLAGLGEEALSRAARPAALLKVTITEALDALRLRRAVEAVVGRHQALRSAIAAVPGYRGIRQRTLDALPASPWQHADLRGEDDPAQAAQAWLAGLQEAPLAIGRGETIRIALATLGDAHHVLALTGSPLAVDAGSLRVLLADILTVYTDAPAEPAEDILQYGQFVEWRQALAEGEDAVDGQAYWRRYLHDARELQAPHPHYRSKLPANADTLLLRHTIIDLPAGLAPDTGAVAQAAWWLLLARLTGFRRFLAGWRNDCRADYAPMRGAVGVFEKTLPLVIDPAPQESFARWQQRLSATLETHVAAQEFWNIENPPVSAQLDTGFAYVEAAAFGAGRAGWVAVEEGNAGARSELVMRIVAQPDRLEVSLQADGGRYSASAAEHLLRQYATLLANALRNPGMPVAELELADEQERALLLAQIGARSSFAGGSVPGAIAHWASATPDAPAVESAGMVLDYRALYARAGRLAGWLKAQGVTRGSLVALALPRSADLLVAMLAAWRAGAAYLPLEPEWPAARRQALLLEAKPALLLSAATPLEMGDGACRAVSWQDIDWTMPEDASPENMAEAGDLAYVLYTSGSTGTPKGVAISHGALFNYVAAATEAMDLRESRRWALTSSVVADLGNTTLFGALHNGACLVIAGEDEIRDSAGFAGFVAQRHIDVLKIVPSHLEALLETAPARLPSTIILGGEAAPSALIARIRQLAPASRLYNHYGPTETTVGVMVHRIAASAQDESQPLSTVLANNRVLVLDERKQPAPVGVAGELHVGGAQLFSGYWRRDEVSAFVAAPVLPGERLYCTGDLAYVRPEGGIQLIGRADHQVKIRGFRVDPAEVEHALSALPGVRQAAILATQDAAGETALTAYVVLDAEGRTDAAIANLREQLAAVLPSPMLPARYVALTAFPRLPNGKIDRHALADSAPAREPAEAGQGRAPGTPLEHLLARGMGLALGREVRGIDEDFFDLGAHSLIVIKFVARLRKLLDIDIAPALVFDHPTVATLAAALRAAASAPAELDTSAECLWREMLAGDGIPDTPPSAAMLAGGNA